MAAKTKKLKDRKTKKLKKTKINKLKQKESRRVEKKRGFEKQRQVKKAKEIVKKKGRAVKQLSAKSAADPQKSSVTKTKKRSVFRRLYRALIGTTRARKRIVFFSVIIGISTWLFWEIPLPTELSTRQVPVSTKLFDRNGKLIFEIYADKRSTPFELEEIPEYVKQSTIAIEDKDFYNHYGVSFQGMVRAVYKIVFKQKLEGGSTLTQQLVKNALLTPERTVRRKVREFALTLAVEAIYTKDQILELYLNQIPYGSTAYGIGAASELYFGKSVPDLSLSEATLLAGLPQAPTRYSPFGARPELAKGRQRTVLRRMVEDGYVKQEEADKAKEVELKYAEPENLKAPHFALWVKDQLAEEYGDVLVEQGGLRVTTTLDLELQDFAQDAVATEVAKLMKSKVGNGAALVTHPKTGEILAMVGSKNYFAEDEDGKVNIIFAERQPGSSIKPLNYALALRDERITLSTPLADVPTCFTVLGQKPYCPVNYDGQYRGAVQARFALGSSYNIPAVRVLTLNGIENFFDFAAEMGITTWSEPSNYGLSLTLGGGEVTPFDMATAFGVFANEGVKVPLISILKVENYKGKVLKEVDINEIEGDRVLTPDVTFLISHTLHDNNARSAAFGEYSKLNVKGHPEVSVKTGTTNDLRDNWTIGYTAHALVVTWVGNNDNSSMSRATSGLSGASPIWNTIMGETLDGAEEGEYSEGDEGHAWPRQPDGVIGASVCWQSGNIAGGTPDAPASGPATGPEASGPVGCPSRFEYFIEGAVGARIESGAKDVQIDKTNGQLANPELPPELVETQNHPFLIDPLGTMVCLDCPIASRSATISYPLSRPR